MDGSARTTEDLAAVVLKAWSQAADGGSDDRAGLTQLLDSFASQWPQLPLLLPSMAESLESLKELLKDPQASLPASLPIAIQLAHDRLAELRLQQLLAQDGAGGTPVAEEVSRTPPSPSPSPPDATRDWWAIPVEGLAGANQIFLLESRELMRGAELCLQALRADPSDYGEQMVLCRAFQALAVASASMGLHRLSAMAQEGQAEFDRLLDEGTPPDQQALMRTEERLARLHAELLELVGEPAPVPRLDAPVAPEALAQDDAFAQDEPPAAHQTQPENQVAIQDEVVAEDELVASPATRPVPAEAAAVPPPWWWALDWSVWSSPPTGEDPPSTLSAPEIGREEADLSMASPVHSPVDHPGAASEQVEAAAPLKLPAERLQSWVDQLRAWQQIGQVDGPTVRALQDEIESATLLPVEAWSVPLFRDLKRVMREVGRPFDFDLEGVGVGASASLLQPFMPMLQAALIERAQADSGPLRLRAHAVADSLVLELLDLGPQPWDVLPAAVTPRQLQQIALRGGAWQKSLQGWCLRIPQRLSRLPLAVVGAGRARAVLPRLWCQADESFTGPDLQAALTEGRVQRADGSWPLLRLSALLKTEPFALADSKVLFLCHGPERLALQVDSVLQLGTAEPVAWPAELRGWLARCGLWGAALGTDGPLPVTDPFALLRRYGAAARVLSRPRPNRAA